MVFGAAAEAQGIAADDAVLAFLHAALSNLVSVGARLIPLGQIESQPDHQGGLAAADDEERRRPAPWSWMRLGSATAGLDIASMRHERLHTRLCMS